MAERRTLLAAAAMLPLMSAPVFAESPQSTTAIAQTSPFKVLLDQAEFWRSQHQPDKAIAALNRLLALDPNNVDALALSAQIEAERGNRPAAQAAITKLKAVRADDPRVREIEQTLRIGTMDQTALSEARRLSQEGKAAQAVQRYQQLLHGGPPPDVLAVEYYQTLAGTQGGWEEAKDGLAQFVARHPEDARGNLAYAEVLTYRDATRLDGVRRLAELAAKPATSAEAARAWRQALQWLPANQASVPELEAWLSKHPDDAAIASRLAEAQHPPRSASDEAAIARSNGFAALNAGRLNEAEALFQAALDRNGQDADALGGLGLVRLRQGRVADARELLTRAIAADPEHRARWESALAGSNVGAEYAQARHEIEHGQLEAAERMVRDIIAHGGDTNSAQLMLADIERRRGNLAAAEAHYRAALSKTPNQAEAVAGLADVLRRQGNESEADALLARAESSGNQQMVARLRADELRKRASATADATQKIALLRSAVADDPSNPWIRLDLARALSASGDKAAARQTMAEATNGSRPGVDALRAGAIFAEEDGRPTDAEALIERLPPSARTAEVRGLRARAQLDRDIRAALAGPGNPRLALLTLAAKPDPDGTRGQAIARALVQAGDKAAVPEALATAQAATPAPTSSQRLAYAGALLGADQTAAAQMMLRSIDSTAGLTPEQVAALDQLRAGLAVRVSDKLNTQGRQADAYDQLAPALSRTPDNPDLNLALARLYQSAREPRKALAINAAVLQRDPGNLDARRAVVNALIELGRFAEADAAARDALQQAPNDPRAWLIAADVARAHGNNRRALHYLETARNLRQQQIAPERAQPSVATYASPPLDPSVAPVSSNPFRHDRPIASEDNGLILPGSPAFPGVSSGPTYAAPDEMMTEINGRIVSLQDELAPKVQLGAGLRGRSGSAGLDQLVEATAPIEGSFSPNGYGQLRFQATPTYLTAGTLAGGVESQRQFGTAALGGAPAPGAQTASGVGLDAKYTYKWLQADVGTTPLGFLEENVVGGIELSPAITDNLRLRISGERRGVTDSVLSYAGTTDPRTGAAWGGVTRLRGHGQLELTAGEANLYAGGGYTSLQGHDVESNQEIEFGAGGSYRVYKGADDEARAGLDLVYFGYDKNLRFFSLGQGGYFSPQNYFAAIIPVTYKQQVEDLTWSVGGSVGYQAYTENNSPIFPNNPALEAALVAESAGNPTIPTAYSGKHASGVVGGAQADVEYRVDPSFRLGGRFAYQRAGDWNEAQGLVYGRYIFNGILQ